MFNFWAPLGPTMDYPLGFASTNILGRNWIQKDSATSSYTEYYAYYLKFMTLGQFYIFNSFVVPHARLRLVEGPTNYHPSIEMRCFYYKPTNSKLKNKMDGILFAPRYIPQQHGRKDIAPKPLLVECKKKTKNKTKKFFDCINCF